MKNRVSKDERNRTIIPSQILYNDAMASRHNLCSIKSLAMIVFILGMTWINCVNGAAWSGRSVRIRDCNNNNVGKRTLSIEGCRTSTTTRVGMISSGNSMDSYKEAIGKYCKEIRKGSVVELFSDKQCRFGIVKEIVVDDSVSSLIEMEPLFDIVMTPCDWLNSSTFSMKEFQTKRVDLGQITTVWFEPKAVCGINGSELDALLREARLLIEGLPVGGDEFGMDKLWNRYRNRKMEKLPFTKKSINMNKNIDEKNKAILRRVLKQNIRGLATGKHVAYELFPIKEGKELSPCSIFAGSMILAKDSKIGGRFKRCSCLFISGVKNNDDPVISVLDGGWLALDSGTRTITEAKRFLDRNAVDKTGSLGLITDADERIANRLESLAMGEEVALNNDTTDMELDVKASLRAMSLPLTPEGAKTALIRIGRWSESDRAQKRENNAAIEPWSREIMNASKHLISYREKLNANYQDYVKQKFQDGSDRTKCFDDRVDLTALPAICVDAKGVSFRDDALSIRPRSVTGRKMNASQSKWELLIHIADVSDIYCVSNENQLFSEILTDASRRRGFSRYDLPLGPLHLLPPIALQTLALDAKHTGNLNRCVTIWAYIDEFSGKLVDFGIERSLIAKVVPLTFDSATKILSTSPEDISHEYKNTKMVLDIFNRIILSWQSLQLSTNEAARERESRLKVKELIDSESKNASQKRRFERRKGHVLVDCALDLYGICLSALLRKAEVPIPRAAGIGAASRGARVGTAPLRRYVDGLAQRQALSALCSFGGKPLSKSECIEASQSASRAKNLQTNVYASKSFRQNDGISREGKQRSALRKLSGHLASFGKASPVRAIVAGKNSEVVIKGVGAIGKCQNLVGNEKRGKEIKVVVKTIVPEKGLLIVQKK